MEDGKSIASDSRHFSKEFQMLPIIPSNRGRSAIPVISVLGIFLVTWAAFQGLSAWASLSPEEAQSVRVGALGNSKCCTHPGYQSCMYSCVLNPNCPQGVVTYSNCNSPSPGCPTLKDHTCNPPTLSVYYDDSYCVSRFSQSRINFLDCNAGDSLCPSSMQPNPYCYAK